MLLRRAFAQCAARRERVITLAVDEDNDPAMSLYRGAGFFRVARKLALIRTLDEPDAETPEP
jgi:ribosomal protein S18 acetylase RimI-like enzyme